MQHDGSGWHWDTESGGEGIQHLALKTDEQRSALRDELRRSNGDPTLEIVDTTQVRTLWPHCRDCNPGFTQTLTVYHAH